MNDKLNKRYNDPIDDNDLVNKRYLDNTQKNIDNKIKDIINGEEPMGNIVVTDITNKNVFNDELAKKATHYKKFGTTTSPGYNSVPLYLKPNTEYTFSRTNRDGMGLGYYCLLKLDGNSNGSFDSTSKWIIHNDADEYNQQIFTFTTSSTGLVLFTVAWQDPLTQSFLDGIWAVLKQVQIEKGSNRSRYTPFKKYGYNSQESMGEIVVDNISCKNLFNKNDLKRNSASINVSILDTGIRLTATTTTGSQYVSYIIGTVSELVGETLTLSCNMVHSSSNTTMARLCYLNDDGTYNSDIGSITSSGSLTKTIGSSTAKYVGVLFYQNKDSSTTTGSYADYTNIQIEKGTVVTEYTSYKDFDTSAYALSVNIASGGSYQNDILKNAKIVIVNWYHSVANWSMQTIHIVGGYSLNTYSTTSCGSTYNSENGTISYQYSTNTDAMVINRILVIK